MRGSEALVEDLQDFVGASSDAHVGTFADRKVSAQMEFTGERAIPGQTDPDLMNEHWARYAFAEALVGSKRVLDAGCGVGYGAARLAEVAAEVVALDQARDPLTAGGKQYSHPRLRFVQGDCTRFPFADSSLDAVVAFEVIEHLDEWKALIEESRRVLVPAGQFIVSTPNRLYYGEAREDPKPVPRA